MKKKSWKKSIPVKTVAVLAVIAAAASVTVYRVRR